MTTKEYFENLLDQISLKLGDKERELIEEKQNALREKLREELPLQEDFLTGSYKRHTIIKPKDEDEKFDVDVFIAFDNEDYGETDLSDLRKMVISALREIKGNNSGLGITTINEEQRRSVGVEFGNNFQIDIVPAIQLEKDKLYKIFDKQTSEAVKSNPKLHGELLSKANNDSGKLLVPLIRILKVWKREKCDYVKSFHIELMAMKIFAGSTIESIPRGLLAFFESAADYFEKACLRDPANEEMLIDEYLDKDGTREEIRTLIEAEKVIAKAAVEAEEVGDDEAAIKEWEKIFTDGTNGKGLSGSTTSVAAAGVASRSFTPRSPYASNEE